MKTKENNQSCTSREFAGVLLEPLTEEQIQYFASELREEYPFLVVEESEEFMIELTDLIRKFIEY